MKFFGKSIYNEPPKVASAIPCEVRKRTKGWLTYQAGIPFAYMLIRVHFKLCFVSASIITARPVLDRR